MHNKSKQRQSYTLYSLQKYCMNGECSGNRLTLHNGKITTQMLHLILPIILPVKKSWT